MGKGFTEMTVAELRAFLAEPDVARHAASMNITHNTKTRKDELIEIARRVHADMITDRRAAESDVDTRVFTPSNYAGMSPDEKRAEVDRRYRLGVLNTDHKDVRRERAAQSHRYGMNGRGMGAKHYLPTIVYADGGPVARGFVIPGTWKIRHARKVGA